MKHVKANRHEKPVWRCCAQEWVLEAVPHLLFTRRALRGKPRAAPAKAIRAAFRKGLRWAGLSPTSERNSARLLGSAVGGISSELGCLGWITLSFRTCLRFAGRGPMRKFFPLSESRGQGARKFPPFSRRSRGRLSVTYCYLIPHPCWHAPCSIYGRQRQKTIPS